MMMPMMLTAMMMRSSLQSGRNSAGGLYSVFFLEYVHTCMQT